MDQPDENTSAAAAAAAAGADELASACAPAVGRQRAQSCSSRQTLPSPTTLQLTRSPFKFTLHVLDVKVTLHIYYVEFILHPPVTGDDVAAVTDDFERSSKRSRQSGTLGKDAVIAATPWGGKTTVAGRRRSGTVGCGGSSGLRPA